LDTLFIGFSHIYCTITISDTINSSQYFESIMFVYVTAATPNVVNSSNRVLVKLLSVMEDIRQTQKIHSAMLQSIQRQMQATSSTEESKLPDNIKLPLSSIGDVDALENTLSDETVKKTLVRSILHCYVILYIFLFLFHTCGQPNIASAAQIFTT